MGPSFFDSIVRKFDDRVALWRSMRAAVGADHAAGVCSKETQEEIRQSMITCHECPATGACRLWLLSARKNAEPPDFCPNRDRFLRLLA